MRKQAAAAWGFWFLGLLVLTPVMTLFDLRPNNVSTGTAVGRPPLTPSRVFDADYYAEIEQWMAETAATRGAGLLMRVKLDYELFGDSTSELVAVGSDGWLFSRQMTDNDCANIDAIGPPPIPPGDEDIVTYMVPLPTSHFLGDRLDEHDRAGDCQIRARQDLRDRLAADPAALDVNSLFDEDAEDLFLKGDPNWSPDGQLRVAEAIIERLMPGLWDPNAVAPATVAEQRSLYRLLGYAGNRSIDGWEVDRELEFRVSGRREGLGVLTWQRSSVEGGEVVPGTTYIFGDAQLANVVPLIDQYFEELVFIGWLGTAAGTIDFTDVPPPDRVIVEALELSSPASFADPLLADVLTRLPDRELPLPATELRAVAVAPTRVEISWTAATDNVGVANYFIARDGTQAGIVDGAATSFVDTAATPDATHEYTVTAIDAAGNFAISDESVTLTMPPPDSSPPIAASEISVTAVGPTTVEITWAAAIDDVALFNYVVARDGRGIVALDPTELAYTDTTASPDTVHTYTVAATDTAGNVTISESVEVTTPPPDTVAPTVPVVTAEATSATTVEVRWTPATDSSGIFNYLVARDGRGIAVLEGDETSFLDEVDPESLHAYTVTATDPAGNSAVSEAVVVATPSA